MTSKLHFPSYRGKTHTDIPNWKQHVNIDHGDVIIAPILECHVEGDVMFSEHVTVCAPHCVVEARNLTSICVYWGDTNNAVKFTVSSCEQKDTAVYYNVHLYITWYTCILHGTPYITWYTCILHGTPVYYVEHLILHGTPVYYTVHLILHVTPYITWYTLYYMVHLYIT